jgi:hypothetical protein
MGLQLNLLHHLGLDQTKHRGSTRSSEAWWNSSPEASLRVVRKPTTHLNISAGKESAHRQMCAGHGQHRWALVEKENKGSGDPISLAEVCILSACRSNKSSNIR